jgi:F0F1-type ATP synthase membrane subunit c/vacuolar-type H+-ATPase subunit K
MEPTAANPQAVILLGKYIGAGLATLGMLGCAIGIGLIFAAALHAIARNPAKEGSIKGFAVFGMALAEIMGLMSFVVAILILYVVKS